MSLPSVPDMGIEEGGPHENEAKRATVSAYFRLAVENRSFRLLWFGEVRTSCCDRQVMLVLNAVRMSSSAVFRCYAKS